MKRSILFTTAVVLACGLAANAADLEPMSKHVNRGFPATADCNRSNTQLPPHPMFGKYTYGLKMMTINVDDLSIAPNAACTETIKLLFEGSEITSFLPSDEGSITNVSMGLTDDSDDLLDFPVQNSWTIIWDSADTLPYGAFTKTGKYTLEIPDGAFLMTLNNETVLLSGISIDYNYTDVADAIDFSYTITPDPSVRLEDATALKKISVKFNNKMMINYKDGCKGGAHLIDPNGQELKGSSYLTMTQPNTIHYTFSNPNEWVDGVYTFRIDGGVIALDDQYFEDYDPSAVGNFGGLEAKFTVGEPAPEMGSLRDHIAYNIPTQTEVNRSNSKFEGEYDGYKYGMKMLKLATDNSTIQPDREVTTPIRLLFNDVELCTVSPADEESVNIHNVNLLAENDGDDLLEFESFQAIAIVWDKANTLPAGTFTKEGKYTVEIPDGAFMMTVGEQNVPLAGVTLNFNYTDVDEAVNFDYVLTPNPDEVIADPSLLKSISIRFADCKTINYAGRGGGHLVGPDGKEIYAAYPQTNFDDEITYKFGNKNTEWTNGLYTFSVDPKCVAVNIINFDEYEDEANFPGLTVVYNCADNESTSVTLVGVEAAESYTVYTVDGKAVLVNAGAESLLGLPAGIYVINGKKAMVR